MIDLGGRKVDCDCESTYRSYDLERVEALDRRLHVMVEANGRPSCVRLSPDICHQLTDGRTVHHIVGVNGVCDPELPPNSIIFEFPRITGSDGEIFLDGRKVGTVGAWELR
jgi:hypothetical protein